MLNPNIEIKKWFVTNLGTATSLPVYDGIAPKITYPSILF